MKKKLITSMLIGATVASMLLSGCASKNNNADKETAKETTKEITTTAEVVTEDKTTESTEEVKPSDEKVSFELIYNGEKFKMDDDIDSVVSKLGKQTRPSSEVSQCLLPGSVTAYYYDGMELWELNKKVVDININKDTIETAEGIKVGMTKDDVINAYGADKYGDETYLIYSNGVFYIKFNLEKDIVTSIGISMESDEVVRRGY